MTKEKLEKEAEKWLRKYLLCCNCEKKCNCIDSNSYCEEQVLKSYVAGAEPREKRIEELIALINAERERQEKCDDVHLRKIAELEKENAELKSGCGMCYRKDKENLTKAKEIIREFVEWATWQGNSKCPSFKNIQNKAEAFLKDSGGK